MGSVPTDDDRHRRTLDVYEGRAEDWEQRRPPRLDEAAEFRRELQRSAAAVGPVVDLGCGPGWHLPELPPGTIALDGAAAMLDRVARHAPDAPRVQADLRALPFGRTTLGGAWANKSYVHLRRGLVPLALWDLHRCLQVGAPLHLGVFGGDEDHSGFDGDEFSGRSFSGWPEPLLRFTLEGAGFAVELIETRNDGDVDHYGVWARRQRTLADTVAPGMRLLLVGLNPSVVSADAGVGFHRNGNRAWPALLGSGLATVDRDPLHLLLEHRIGMTDVVKRASPRANELTGADFVHGIARLEALCSWLRPAAVCVIGLSGWRSAVDRQAVAGEQVLPLGGRPVYLMPNPSGINTHASLGDLTEHFVAAARLADRSASGEQAEPPAAG